MEVWEVRSVKRNEGRGNVWGGIMEVEEIREV